MYDTCVDFICVDCEGHDNNDNYHNNDDDDNDDNLLVYHFLISFPRGVLCASKKKVGKQSACIFDGLLKKKLGHVVFFCEKLIQKKKPGMFSIKFILIARDNYPRGGQNQTNTI